MTSRHLVRPGRTSSSSRLRRERARRDCAGGPSSTRTCPVPCTRGSRSWSCDRGGRIPWHVHSYEDSLYVLGGRGRRRHRRRREPASARRLRRDAGRAHRTRSATSPRRPSGGRRCGRRSRGRACRATPMRSPGCRSASPTPIDVRDPRTRSFGHIDPANMEVDKQTQDMLAVSASMRTALLVYSGITVKMMVDADLGAQLLTMFMVQYEPRGLAGRHDHPYEETYLILDGEVDAEFDGERYHLVPGRRRVGRRRLRARVHEPGTGDRALARDAGAAAAASPLLPVRPGLGVPDRRPRDGRDGCGWLSTRWWWSGGTHGLGRDLARHYAEAGRRVVVTGRDAERAALAAPPSSAAPSTGSRSTSRSRPRSRRPSRASDRWTGWCSRRSSAT